jgi:hypothetical protein
LRNIANLLGSSLGWRFWVRLVRGRCGRCYRRWRVLGGWRWPLFMSLRRLLLRLFERVLCQTRVKGDDIRLPNLFHCRNSRRRGWGFGSVARPWFGLPDRCSGLDRRLNGDREGLSDRNGHGKGNGHRGNHRDNYWDHGRDFDRNRSGCGGNHGWWRFLPMIGLRRLRMLRRVDLSCGSLRP